MYQYDSFGDFRLIYKYVYVLAKRTFFCLNHINNNITRVNLFTYRTIPEVHSICANGAVQLIFIKFMQIISKVAFFLRHLTSEYRGSYTMDQRFVCAIFHVIWKIDLNVKWNNCIEDWLVNKQEEINAIISKV